MVVAKRPAGAEPTPAASPAGGRRAFCCCTSRSSGPSVPRVRDMLGDGDQEVGGGEDLEVAVDLGLDQILGYLRSSRVEHGLLINLNSTVDLTAKNAKIAKKDRYCQDRSSVGLIAN